MTARRMRPGSVTVPSGSPCSVVRCRRRRLAESLHRVDLVNTLLMIIRDRHLLRLLLIFLVSPQTRAIATVRTCGSPRDYQVLDPK